MRGSLNGRTDPLLAVWVEVAVLQLFEILQRMEMSRVFVVVGCAVLVGLSGCNAHVEDTRPGQPVKTRQVAFQEILKVFEPMGVMLRTDKYEADRFAALAAELTVKRDQPWTHFSADTNYPPTKAQEAVWSQADEFERKKQAFIAATDVLNAAAKTKDMEAASKAYFEVYDTCKSCHNQFKKR
jgi:cytochrome c556